MKGRQSLMDESLLSKFLRGLEQALDDHPHFHGKTGFGQKALRAVIRAHSHGECEAIEQLPQQSLQYILQVFQGQIIKLPTDYLALTLPTMEFLTVQAIFIHETAVIEHQVREILKTRSAQKREERKPRRQTKDYFV